jgi:hypothetical protein
VRGPFVLTLQESRVNLTGWRADNMDNGVSGLGAAWTVPLASGESLEPGERTPTRVLRWTFSGVPEEPSRPVFIFAVRSR